MQNCQFSVNDDPQNPPYTKWHDLLNATSCCLFTTLAVNTLSSINCEQTVLAFISENYPLSTRYSQSPSQSQTTILHCHCPLWFFCYGGCVTCHLNHLYPSCSCSCVSLFCIFPSCDRATEYPWFSSHWWNISDIFAGHWPSLWNVHLAFCTSTGPVCLDSEEFC